MAEAAENMVGSFFDGAGDAANERPESHITSAGQVRAIRPERALDRSILAFPAALLGHLPVAVSLELSTLAGRMFAVVMDPASAAARRADGEDILDGADWEILVTATESDRLFAAQLGDVVVMRREKPLALDVVLGGARPDAPQGFTVERVLQRIGATVLAASVAVPEAMPTAA